MIERALCPVLVGREEELTVLEDSLLAAARGEGHVVVLAGDAGLGKTRLAVELGKRARKVGCAVMWGGCSEAELALPYLPFLEAVGNYLTAADLDDVSSRLGPARRELGQIFPQLGAQPSADLSDPTQAKLRLFEAVLALLQVAAGERGLLLVAEDLHWADASSRELLDYMSRRLGRTNMMLLATYRSDEMHRKHPLLPIVHGWRRAGLAQAIELSPLVPENVAAMVGAIFDRDEVSNEFRDFLHDRTEGNPFVLEEMLKEAIDRGDIYRTDRGWERKGLDELRIPRSVADSILLRVERLESAEADVLRAASVLGPAFAYSTLVALTGQADGEVQDALRACVTDQLLEEEPQRFGWYRFRHALTREAVYEDLILPRRQQLHARAAEVLRDESGTAQVELARHLLAAGAWEDAVPVCLGAAEEAMAGRGFREAADLYERALPHVTEPLERGRLLGKLGEAYWLSGNQGAAARYLEEGVALLEGSGARFEAARSRLFLGRCHWEMSRPDLARAEYERARAALEEGGPSEDLANAYVRLAGMHAFEFEGAEAQRLAERAIEVAEEAGADAPRIWAHNFLGLGLIYQGRVPGAGRRGDRVPRPQPPGGGSARPLLGRGERSLQRRPGPHHDPAGGGVRAIDRPYAGGRAGLFSLLH